MHTTNLPTILLTLLGCLGATASTIAESSDLNRADIRALVAEEARRQGFPPAVALGVAKVESDFQADVISHKGAVGVMQILPRTARGEYGVRRADLFDPYVNVHTGVRFLSDLYAQYGRMDIALSHYNGGSAVRAASGELRIIPATRAYVHRVLQNADRYQSYLATENHSSSRQASLTPRGSAEEGIEWRWYPSESSAWRASADERCARIDEWWVDAGRDDREAAWLPQESFTRRNTPYSRRALVRSWERVYAQ